MKNMIMKILVLLLMWKMLVVKCNTINVSIIISKVSYYVLHGKNTTVTSATVSEEMREEDDSLYLSHDEEHDNEEFSTAVDVENDCCEV